MTGTGSPVGRGGRRREGGVCRRFGTRLWWGVPVSLRPDLDKQFDVRLYGVGFWMVSFIPGVLIWRRRSDSPAQGGPA